MRVAIKRVYDEPSPDDGTRVLVDRLWPRGIAKGDAQIQVWAKELAPSTELRRWFGHEPGRFQEFARRYQTELRRNEDAVAHLLDRIDLRKRLTLVYAAKNPQCNHAMVLQQYLEKREGGHRANSAHM